MLCNLFSCVQEANKTGVVSGEITWSGYTWEVESYEEKLGPGPNYFSDSIENIWVDGYGKLHLKITNVDGKWVCVSLGSKESFGYGTYRFYVSSRIDTLNENVVVGLFTWDSTSSDYHNREIDIEFARWGNMEWPNLNYSVQPYDISGNARSTHQEMSSDLSVHWFNWQEDKIEFKSVFGSTYNTNDIMDEWIYTGSSIPPVGNEKIRINIWLKNGAAPSDSKEVEFIIDRFEFVK